MSRALPYLVAATVAAYAVRDFVYSSGNAAAKARDAAAAHAPASIPAPLPAAEDAAAFAPVPPAGGRMLLSEEPAASALEAGPPVVTVSLCTSWGYRKHWEGQAAQLRALFPGVQWQARTQPPEPWKAVLSTALSYAVMVALAYLVLGSLVLDRLGWVEPAWLGGLRANKLGLLAAYFLVNMVVTNLGSTGAYEVALATGKGGGRLLFSKLATGAVPTVGMIAEALVKAGHTPVPAVAAQLGLHHLLPAAGMGQY